jgi:hypothetical protein
MSAGHTRRRQARVRRLSTRRRAQHERRDRTSQAHGRITDPDRLADEARRLREEAADDR